MANYLDEIDFLSKTSYKIFWPIIGHNNNNTVDEFRKNVTSYWASSYTIAKCYDDPSIDPIEVLDEEANTYQIESLFGHQDINKKNFETAYLALMTIREELIKRRETRE